MPCDVLAFRQGCFAVLLMEDCLTSWVVAAMFLLRLIDQQFLTAPLVLLGLHATRAVVLMVPLALNGPFAWPVPPAATVGMAMSCALLRFNQPLHLLTYMLCGQATASTILALLTCGLSKKFHQRASSGHHLPTHLRQEQETDISASQCSIRVQATAEASIREPHELVQARDLDLKKQNTCVICLQGFEDDEVLLRLTCGHVHHATCIQTWFSKGKGGCTLGCSRRQLPPVVSQIGDQEWFC